MATTVTAAVIAATLGRTAPSPESPEAQQWAAWILEAEYLIGRDPRVMARLMDDKIGQADLDYVVTQAVLAHVRAWRPDATRRVAVAIDDGRTEREYWADAGRLTIGDDLWGILLGEDAASGAWSIRPSYVPGGADRSCWGLW